MISSQSRTPGLGWNVSWWKLTLVVVVQHYCKWRTPEMVPWHGLHYTMPMASPCNLSFSSNCDNFASKKLIPPVKWQNFSISMFSLVFITAIWFAYICVGFPMWDSLLVAAGFKFLAHFASSPGFPTFETSVCKKPGITESHCLFGDLDVKVPFWGTIMPDGSDTKTAGHFTTAYNYKRKGSYLGDKAM